MITRRACPTTWCPSSSRSPPCGPRSQRTRMPWRSSNGNDGTNDILTILVNLPLIVLILLMILLPTTTTTNNNNTDTNTNTTTNNKKVFFLTRPVDWASAVYVWVLFIAFVTLWDGGLACIVMIYNRDLSNCDGLACVLWVGLIVIWSLIPIPLSILLMSIRLSWVVALIHYYEGMHIYIYIYIHIYIYIYILHIHTYVLYIYIERER